MTVHKGVTEAWFETGLECLVWAITEDGKTGYDSLKIVEEGDHLLITDENKAVLFDGVIEPDRQTGWTEYPMNPGHGQQAACGMWIHWIQKGWAPDDWAKLFLDKDPQPRAVLTKKST